MKNGFETMVKQARQIPWASAASFFSELRRDETIHVPALTKEAAIGAIKLARLRKAAQGEEQFAQAVQGQAMVDPDVVAALDYEQAMAEIEALRNKLEEYEAENQIMQQQLAMSDQQSQQAQMQMQQMGQQLQQEQMQRQAITDQAVQAQDAALKSRVDMSTYRQQIVDGADQLLLQLKQMIAQDPAMQQAQMQQQAMMEQQAAQVQQAQGQPMDQGQAMDQGQMSMGEAAGQPMDQGPMYEETRKQLQEADNSAQQAQMQAQQADQAAMEEQAKMGSARARAVTQLLKMARAKSAMDPRMAELAKSLGIRAAGAGLGALAGGGVAVYQQAAHRGQYGDRAATTVSAPEVDLAAQRAAAEVKAKADPTFMNKLRVVNLQRREDLARISRENPDGAIAFGALLGAGTGAAVAPSVYGLGQRVFNIAKGQGQLGRLVRGGVDAAKEAVPALAGAMR